MTDLRIRQNREFFNVSPSVALDIFRDIASTIDDAKITVYRNNVPIDEDQAKDVAKQGNDSQCRRKPFRFSMVNIEVGETVTFAPTGLEVKVADDKKIEYEGRLYTLSAFVGTFLPEEQQNVSVLIKARNTSPTKAKRSRSYAANWKKNTNEQGKPKWQCLNLKWKNC